jgi:hypothetical protein
MKMPSSPRLILLGTVLLGSAAALAVAAPVPTVPTETVQERVGFIPQRQSQPLPGRVVGVLASDVAGLLGSEGRNGRSDVFAFSVDGNSYRRVYLSVADRPQLDHLNVRVGARGEQVKVYPSLSPASAAALKPWNIDGSYALVEVEVNDGLGSPPEEAFVATRLRRLDGTDAFPALLPDIVAEARKRQQAWLAAQQPALEAGWADLQTRVIKERTLTGPRETKDVLYITWLPERERLRLSFRTTLTDGVFETGPAGPGSGRGGGPGGPGGARGPRPQPTRWGTMVGIDLGVGYDVTRTGRFDRSLILPLQTSSSEIPAPPRGGRGPRMP